MTMQARPVVKNKYWIVEKDGQKVATIQVANDGVVLVQGEQRSKYPSIKLLGTANNIQFVREQKKIISTPNSIYNYPTRGTPHNTIYDIKHKLPLYTSSKDSKSYYCAGYYLVQYGSQYALEFCPKKIVLVRNNFFGPFITEDAAQIKLKEINRSLITTYK